MISQSHVSQKSSQELLKIGRVLGVHGLKGVLKVELLAGKNSSLSAGEKIYLSVSGETLESFEILNISHGPKHSLLELAEMNTLELAQKFTGKEFSLWIYRHQLAEAPDDQLYIIDLLGLDVFEAPDSLAPWAQIRGTYSNGVQEVMELTTHEGQQLDLPWVNAHFYSVDLERKRVYCHRPHIEEA